MDLNVVVRECLGENGRISSIYPYPADAVRHMLFTRMFGNGNGAEQLSLDDANTMVIFKGNFVRRQLVRDEVMAVIEVLVRDLTRDPSVEYNESQSHLVDWLTNTSLPEGPTASQDPASGVLQEENQAHAPRPNSFSRNSTFRSIVAPQQQQAFNTGSNTAATSSQNVPAQSTAMPPHQQGNSEANTQAARPAQGVTMTHPQPQSLQQPTFLPTTAAPNPPIYATAGPGPLGHGYPFPGAGQMHYQPPVPAHMYASQMPPFGPGYGPQVPPPQLHLPQQGTWPIAFHGHTYGNPQPQVPFYQPQPVYAPHFAAYPMFQRHQTQQPMLNLDPFPNALGPTTTTTTMAMASSMTSTPAPTAAAASLGRTALAPASRQAPTSSWAHRAPSFNIAAWAQEHRPPTPPRAPAATPSSTQPNPEWNNRFGGGGRSAAPTPDLPLMPYRAGTDVMYPRGTGGASVQMQDLTRQGAPAFQTLTDRANIPFGEIAKDSRPAQWGVAKLGNVSRGAGRK